ncbi:MAG: hypothetical protein Q4C70_05810, partial [Planctomycetia bacterium]|nr:hypothetical protein [Planctomycetia bacterium]
MDRNRHSGRNENVSRFETLNEVDSLLEELKKSVADENIGTSARKRGTGAYAEQGRAGRMERFVDTERERFASMERAGIPTRELGLPQPGKRLQSLLDRVDFVHRDYHNSEFSTRKSRLEMERNALPSVRPEDNTVAKNMQKCDALMRRLNGVAEVEDYLSEAAMNLDSDYVATQVISASSTSETVTENVPESVSESISEMVSEQKSKMETETAENTSEIAENAENAEVIETDSGSVRETAEVIGETLGETVIEPEKLENGKSVKGKTWGRALVGAEISVGMLLGLGLVMGAVNMQYPMEKRLFHEFQQSVPVSISCDEVENNFLKTELTFGSLTACATQEKERFADISVQRTDFQLSATSQFRPVLGVRSVSMEGVEFPNLAQPALRDSWRPTPIVPLFSDEVKEVLATRSQSLESLRFLEEVKGKHLPIYQEISSEVTRINKEVETLEKKLLTELGVKELTPEVLKSEALKRPEMVVEVEKLGKLRQEAIDIQARWMTLNQDVATDLAKIREKIAADGKAFSTILHYEFPTESMLSEYLFRTDVQRRLTESLNWATAVSRLAEMGTMTGARKQADKLHTDGTIELFGQSFAFNGDWETNIEEECEYSYRGSLQLNSSYLPEELLRDAFVTVACRKKANSELRTITARIPVMNDTFVWGDYKSLPLYGRFQEGAVVVDLTLFGEEIRGKISLEMNGVSFNAPDVPAEKARILYAKMDGKELPAVNIDAVVSGTRNEPKIECNSAFSQEFLPVWGVAMQEIHQATRKEMITSIYEQLKNAETAFNGTLEPFYQEILVCAQKTDVFRNFPSLKGKVEPRVDAKESQLVDKNFQRDAVVDVTPMNLAHLEVSQDDLDENIPVYNPNIGMTPMPSAPTGAVGSQVKEPAKSATTVKPMEKDSE